MYKEVLETKDLILRKARLDDVVSIYQNYWSDAESAKFMLWKVTPNLDVAQEKLERSINFQKDKIAYIIEEKKSGKVIGSAGVIEIEPGVFDDAGIGFGIPFTGKGYGKQVLYCFMKYLFDVLEAKKFFCSCFRENINSAKLQKSMGFEYFGTTEKVRPFDGYEYLCDTRVITCERFHELKTQKYYKRVLKMD